MTLQLFDSVLTDCYRMALFYNYLKLFIWFLLLSFFIKKNVIAAQGATKFIINDAQILHTVLVP